MQTKMLASVNCVEEALTVLECGVDIIDLKNPSQGALGALPLDLVKDIVKTIDGRGIISATIGDLPMEVDVVKKGTEDMISTGVDIVKIGFFGTENHVACIRALKPYADAGTKLVAVLFAENGSVVHLVPELADAGFYGVMVDTAVKNGLTLTDHYDHDAIKEFVDLAKEHDLLVGLAGSIKLYHVKQLKPYKPSYLGFRGALCDNHQRTATLNVDKVKGIVEEMVSFEHIV
jgi:(5-formylfuran-3-yl)methyl phosphate synthase